MQKFLEPVVVGRVAWFRDDYPDFFRAVGRWAKTHDALVQINNSMDDEYRRGRCSVIVEPFDARKSCPYVDMTRRTLTGRVALTGAIRDLDPATDARRIEADLTRLLEELVARPHLDSWAWYRIVRRRQRRPACLSRVI